MGGSTPWVQSKERPPYPAWAAGGHQDQPARRNLPAGSTPPPADDIQSEAPAPASQSSIDAVPYVHWYHTKRKICQKAGKRWMDKKQACPVVKTMHKEHGHTKWVYRFLCSTALWDRALKARVSSVIPVCRKRHVREGLCSSFCHAKQKVGACRPLDCTSQLTKIYNSREWVTAKMLLIYSSKMFQSSQQAALPFLNLASIP